MGCRLMGSRKRILPFGPSVSFIPTPRRRCMFEEWDRKRILPFGPSAPLHPSHTCGVGPSRLRPRVARVLWATPLAILNAFAPSAPSLQHRQAVAVSLEIKTVAACDSETCHAAPVDAYFQWAADGLVTDFSSGCPGSRSLAPHSVQVISILKNGSLRREV